MPNKSTRSSTVAAFPAPMLAALVRGARSCVRLGPFTHGKAIHHRQRFYKLRKAMQAENHHLAPIAIKTTIRIHPCNGQTKNCMNLDKEIRGEVPPFHYLEIDSDEKDELVIAIRDAGIDIEMDDEYEDGDEIGVADNEDGYDAGKDDVYRHIVEDGDIRDNGDYGDNSDGSPEPEDGTESTIKELFPDD